MRKEIAKYNKQALLDFAHSNLESEKFAGEHWGCDGGVYEMYPKEDTDKIIEKLSDVCDKKERALWRSRAKVARLASSLWATRGAYYKDAATTKFDINGISEGSEFTSEYKTKRTIDEWVDIWDDIELLCESKAENL